MTRQESTAELMLTPFERHVKEALRLYERPERLGRESPLASPYVLGRALLELPRPLTDQARGEVLCAELRRAARRLWPGMLPTTRDEALDAIVVARRDPDDPRYAFVVLELRCFHQWITPYRTSDIWEQPHLLPGSKSQHYRDFDAAVKRLATLLLDHLRPMQRPERPRPPPVLYGYDRQLELVMAALQRGDTVSISGPGGVGKTSIAVLALTCLPDRPSFWYTIRPDFNDRASSLLFALGAFLHQQGAASLSQYLLTTNGLVGDLNLAAGLLRHDCASLAPQLPIVCLDDFEHLSAGDMAMLPPEHAQFLSLVDELCSCVPTLLVGQRGLPTSDLHITLQGLDVAQTERFWRDAGLELAPAEIVRLHRYASGNPRILSLLLALKRMGEEIALPDDAAIVAPAMLVPAFERVWRRLRPDERRALQRLCVYRGYAPDDLIATETRADLEGLRLVETDGQGGMLVVPALAPVVYRGLSAERREQLHGEAAMVHLERGETTAAAYHFVQSNQDQQALRVWFPQRREAIARGEGDLARQIFAGMSRQRLPLPERKALDLLRAELRLLAGEHDTSLRELEDVDWLDDSEAGARLHMLRGELQDALGYPDQSLASYAEGIGVASRLLAQVTLLHQRRGLLFYRQRELSQSWQEIHRAEFHIAVLRGYVRIEEGAYDDALLEYEHAAALAETLADDLLRAQIARQLASLWGRRERLDRVIEYAGQALDIYQRLGDQVNRAKMQSNLSAVYVQMRQPHQALEAGLAAYAFFQAARDPYFAAVTAANLAEASYELGDVEHAAQYARAVLDLRDRHAAPYACYTLGQVALAQEQVDRAVAWFSEAMTRAQHNNDVYMQGYAERSLAEVYLPSQPERAREHLVSARAIFQQLAIESEIAATSQLLESLPRLHDSAD